MMTKMENKISKIFLTLIFVFVIANATAQNDPIIVQLVDYDSETTMSRIFIQNNAGVDLTEVKFYINGIKTGTVSDKIYDGDAVSYFQSITPGTYDITIKTKEIEVTKQITFKDTKKTSEQEQDEAPKIKTASQLAEDPEYQKLLEEQKKEREIRRQRQLEQQKIEEQKETEQKTVEEKLQEKVIKRPESITEKLEDNRTSIVLILILLGFIFLIIGIFKRKKGK